MADFLYNFTSTWWGLSIAILVALALWFGLSAIFYRCFFKRFYDIVLSGLAIVVLSPLLLFLTILTAIKMKGNPFFTQHRPGKNEKIFKLIKYRTMTNEKDEEGNLLPDAKRLTKYGKFLRSTSLDELPELFNIFIGQMSIVGPRPLLVEDMVFMSDEVRKRHNIRGGLTGLAQVNGRNNQSFEKRFLLDLEYLKTFSLIKDLIIVAKTIKNVILKKDIATEGMQTTEDYGDYLLEINAITQEEYNLKQEEACLFLKTNSR